MSHRRVWVMSELPSQAFSCAAVQSSAGHGMLRPGRRGREVRQVDGNPHSRPYRHAQRSSSEEVSNRSSRI
jgi:hypothetical protein